MRKGIIHSLAAALVASAFITISSASLVAVTVESLTRRANSEQPTVAPTTPTRSGQQNEFAGKTVDQYATQQVPYKDPRLSCLLAFIIPGGGGHFYLRKDVKAVLICVGVSLGYLAGTYFLVTGLIDSAATSSIILGSIFSLVGVVVHIVSMVEAYNDAVEINEAKYYREY